MSIVSGTVGAVLGSSAQNKATRANLEAARQTNEMNYKMFQEGRGAGGNALLPLYFGGQEKQIARDATANYNAVRALQGSPAEQLARYQAATGKFMPMIDASTGALADVYNGNLTENRLQYMKPVAEARTALARTGRQGIMEGLQERINALNAESARKGYSGTGSFAQNRLLDSTIRGRQQAAGMEAGAALENAADARSIQDAGANMKLQYMNMPYQLAQQRLAYENMPMNLVQENFARQLQPFEFFRMQPAAFQNAPMPMQGADTTWPAIMNSIGNFNQGLAQMYLGGAFGGGGGAGAAAGAAGAAAGGFSPYVASQAAPGWSFSLQ